MVGNLPWLPAGTTMHDALFSTWILQSRILRVHAQRARYRLVCQQGCCTFLPQEWISVFPLPPILIYPNVILSPSPTPLVPIPPCSVRLLSCMRLVLKNLHSTADRVWTSETRTAFLLLPECIRFTSGHPLKNVHAWFDLKDIPCSKRHFTSGTI